MKDSNVKNSYVNDRDVKGSDAKLGDVNNSDVNSSDVSDSDLNNTDVPCLQKLSQVILFEWLQAANSISAPESQDLHYTAVKFGVVHCSELN